MVFFAFSGFAQLGSPSLRCLQVATNGDATLTWIPPADPLNIFDSYDIYYSTNNTTFSLIATLAGSVGTSSYVHLGAGADVQSRYYFIRTKSGTSGNGVSAPSDTLRTIFLNLNPGNGGQEFLKITYNNVHQPKLSTTNANFSILKEYPIGTWSTFTVTNAIAYNDTLSVCQASMNYQIRLLDNSGCVSTSNFQGGIYNDKKNPNEPVIDSISVLPNGNVILAWRVPRDPDIVKYRIYELSVVNSATINAIIDTVIGRNSSSYTFVTGSMDQPISIFLSSLDSCARISPFTNDGGTMFLTQKYDRCNYTTALNWTPYKNMPKGIREYRIYYSPDATNFTVIGTTTATSFSHLKVDPDKNVCYYIRAFSTDNAVTSSSNKVCFYSTQVIAPAYVYIKSASVIRNTINLRIFLDNTKSSKGIDILRSEDGVSFSPIGFVPFRGADTYTFVDKTDIQPSTKSYYYQGTIKDSCGNTRTVSNIVKTIVLKISDDQEFIFTKHLSWSNYIGFAGGVASYDIYRVLTDSTNLELVGNSGLFSTSFTDNLEYTAEKGSKVEYYVEAIEASGNPYGFVSRAGSNRQSVYIEGRIFIPEAFAPRGKNKVWRPITHFIDKNEYSVKIFNRWGEKVFDSPDDTVGWDGDGAPTGIYAYVISYKNSRGEYLELKGTLLLL